MPLPFAQLFIGFGINLRKPRRREREVGCKRWKAFKHPPHAADRHNRIAHQAQRSQILTSSPLSAVSLYGSHSFLRCCHTVRELSLVLQNKTSKSVEKVRGYNKVVSKRFCKKQQMQWTKRGAHLLLQTRVKTLNGELGAVFKRWYPDMQVEELAEAA